MRKLKLAVVTTAALFVAGAAHAQQAIDWDKIQIKTTDLGNNTYMLMGQGGNMILAVGTDGLILVDTEFAPLYDKIKAAIAAISPLRPTTSTRSTCWASPAPSSASFPRPSA